MTRATHWARGSGKVGKGPQERPSRFGGPGKSVVPHPFGGGSGRSPDAALGGGKSFSDVFLCIRSYYTVAFFPFLSVFCCAQVVFLKQVPSKQTLLPWPWGSAIWGASADPMLLPPCQARPSSCGWLCNCKQPGHTWERTGGSVFCTHSCPQGWLGESPEGLCVLNQLTAYWVWSQTPGPASQSAWGPPTYEVGKGT